MCVCVHVQRGFFISDIRNLIVFIRNQLRKDVASEEEEAVQEPLLINGEVPNGYM